MVLLKPMVSDRVFLETGRQRPLRTLGSGVCFQAADRRNTGEQVTAGGDWAAETGQPVPAPLPAMKPSRRQAQTRGFLSASKDRPQRPTTHCRKDPRAGQTKRSGGRVARILAARKAGNAAHTGQSWRLTRRSERTPAKLQKIRR